MIFDTIYGKKGVNQPLLLMVRNATWKGLVVVAERIGIKLNGDYSVGGV